MFRSSSTATSCVLPLAKASSVALSPAFATVRLTCTTPFEARVTTIDCRIDAGRGSRCRLGVLACVTAAALGVDASFGRGPHANASAPTTRIGMMKRLFIGTTSETMRRSARRTRPHKSYVGRTYQPLDE